MTDITISNAQHRVLEDAANFPESEIEKFTAHLPAGARKAMINALVKKGCIEKRGNTHYITATGLGAVGHDATPCNKPQRETKQSVIMAMLAREEGATVAELIEATGWKSHSVRGHISNLRRKGKANIEAFTRSGGGHCYRLAQVESAA